MYNYILPCTSIEYVDPYISIIHGDGYYNDVLNKPQ